MEVKEVSKWSMVLAIVWIMVNTIVKGVLQAKGMEYLSMVDILLSGILIPGVFSPAYISIWIDKIKAIKEAI